MKIGLVQINNSFSGQNYLPLSVGLLQGYVQNNAADPGRYEFLVPIESRRRVDSMVAELDGADVVGFSVYVWNANVSLAVAEAVKRKKPETLIIFGGPQVPDRAEDFLGRHTFIDVVCHGEGEGVFLSLLENHPGGAWQDVPSISYLSPDGRFVNNPRGPRLADLQDLASPYLDDVFAPLMESNPGRSWLALWETNRGCPFSCTFCDWGSAVAAKVYAFDLEKLHREVDWFARNRIEFVFCCDANFGILPRDVEIAKHIAKVKEATGYPHALSVQNTKNATERAYEVQKILSEAGLNKGVTISLQSLDTETLKSIKRQNISSESFQELQHRFTRDGVETYTDMILGLPGETYDSFIDGISAVIESGQHNRIQFNNLSILPNSEMGDPDYQKKFGMRTVPSQIHNIHGTVEELAEEVPEVQDLVIATNTMPKEDWVKARAFCWTAGLLHFDKVLQIPLVLTHEVGGVSYRSLLEAFAQVNDEAFPTLARIKGFFEEKARDIQTGGPEYCHSDDWLGIGWPADEYVLIDLCSNDCLDEFYEESERRIEEVCRVLDVELPDGLLREAVRLNRCLLKLPFQTSDLTFKGAYNVWEFYQSVLKGSKVPLDGGEAGKHKYHINRTESTFGSWDEWCREVIWYGNKKGAYLYGNDMVERQLAGHF